MGFARVKCLAKPVRGRGRFCGPTPKLMSDGPGRITNPARPTTKASERSSSPARSRSGPGCLKPDHRPLARVAGLGEWFSAHPSPRTGMAHDLAETGTYTTEFMIVDG